MGQRQAETRGSILPVSLQLAKASQGHAVETWPEICASGIHACRTQRYADYAEAKCCLTQVSALMVAGPHHVRRDCWPLLCMPPLGAPDYGFARVRSCGGSPLVCDEPALYSQPAFPGKPGGKADMGRPH